MRVSTHPDPERSDPAVLRSNPLKSAPLPSTLREMRSRSRLTYPFRGTASSEDVHHSRSSIPDVNASDPADTTTLKTALDEPRRQFLATVQALRPALHRFCSRMCGSVLDGEDVVQETLAQAFYHLQSLRDVDRLEPWLFRIAHHKCVDFLRRERRTREDTVPYEEEHAPIVPADEDDAMDDEPVSGALAALVGALPPKERACVLRRHATARRQRGS